MALLVVLAALVAVAALGVAVAAVLLYLTARKVHEAAAMVFWDRHIERPRRRGPDDDGGEPIPVLRMVS